MKRIEPTWSWARKYLQNRVARIYPLYFILTLLTFLIFQLDSSYDFINLWSSYKPIDKLIVIILNLTFLRGFFSNYFFTGISQGWSLTAEETFYILAPLIFLTTKGNIKKVILLSAFSLGIGIVLAKFFSSFSGPLRGFFGSEEFMFQWTYFGHSLEFAVGIALAYIISKWGEIKRKGSWSTYIGVVWIIACAAFIATMETINAPIAPVHLKIITINFLLPPGIALLFYGLLSERTIFRHFLETKTLDLLGKSSYAFYLLHSGVLSVALLKLHVPTLLSLVITTIISILVFKLIEEPLHKKLKSTAIARV